MENSASVPKTTRRAASRESLDVETKDCRTAPDPGESVNKFHTKKSLPSSEEHAHANDVKLTSQQSSRLEEDPDSSSSTSLKKIAIFYQRYEFVCLIVVAILLARAYPPLGADYLAPHITATWIAVIIIFAMAGLGLKTEELTKAFQRLFYNCFLQIFNFGAVSGMAYVFSRLMVEAGIIDQSLADGMVVCACLPLTINMVLVLTKSSGGDEASAIFNAAFGNMLGVFLSPILILGYLGVTGDVQLVQVFVKLAVRVLAPVVMGQVLQKTSPRLFQFYKDHKRKFKAFQMYLLVFIVYTVFCRTFQEESQSEVMEIFWMILFQFLLLCTSMALAWVTLGVLFHDEPTLRVAGLFCCTHKTVAMGIPLINAIYEKDPLIGLYTLPLLIWHPMQLVIGSILSPRLATFVKHEQQRLGIDSEEESPENHRSESGSDQSV